ncbi:hypothetical protein HC928_18895 [bacterium]|nr:hypothetical protein [bacterium]
MELRPVVAAPDALTVDLEGHTVFPGLINAHDHLELNTFCPRSAVICVPSTASVTTTLTQWGEDVNAHLDSARFRTGRAAPLANKLFIGGLKNLLSGVTTVAHHGPPHRPLFRRDFPVRVLRGYGWAHSLHFSTEAEIVRSYRKTPREWPWFIHLAEGTDEGRTRRVPAAEGARLRGAEHDSGAWRGHERGGHRGRGEACTRPRVVPDDEPLSAGRNRACASVGRSGRHRQRFAADGRRRLPGRGAGRDRRRRLRCAGGTHPLHVASGSESAGHGGRSFAPGQPADFWIQGGHPVRDNIRLIVRGGVPVIGDTALMHRFPHVRTVPVTLDAAPKTMHLTLARKVAACTLKEPGLELLEQPPPRWQTWY